MIKKIVLLLVLSLVGASAFAQTGAFQLSLTPDVAIQPRTTQIEGFTLGVWSENPQNGFALGLVNGSTGHSSGLSLGLLGNYSDSYRGAQIAWLANYAKGDLVGFQCAAFNYAASLHGLQLGYVNYAGASNGGVQIGLVNIMNETKDWFRQFPHEVAPAMVLVNWRF